MVSKSNNQPITTHDHWFLKQSGPEDSTQKACVYSPSKFCSGFNFRSSIGCGLFWHIVVKTYVMYLFCSQIRQDKPSHRPSLPNDAQVSIVCATLPEELLEDTLQDILPVG